MIPERYSRQIRYAHIGEKGQEKLLSSTVVIVGMGALGCVSANELVRAGVGHVRFVDRDLVELSNLQRQVLYTETDAAEAVPKVFAAAEYLKAVNSEVEIEPVFGDLNAGTIDALFSGADLIVDATDKLETRYLINEYCVEHQIPWVYGGAVGAEGMTAAFLPGGPCFCCFSGHAGVSGQTPGRTCSTVGVLNTLTATVASLQVTEALKILTGSDSVRKDPLYVELWDNDFYPIPMEKNPDCPVCVHHRYTYLGSVSGTQAVSVCGKNAYQIVPSARKSPDFQALSEKLSALGKVTLRSYYLEFESPSASFRLFKDGRAIISNADTEGRAKSVYSEYIGGL
jgi:adenylyltransferase/sulfurtransferase